MCSKRNSWSKKNIIFVALAFSREEDEKEMKNRSCG
jgi:hypothetical protein